MLKVGRCDIFTQNGILFIHKRGKKVLPLVTAWMDLEGIMPIELSQTEKDKYYMISPICGI